MSTETHFEKEAEHNSKMAYQRALPSVNTN